MKKHVKCPHCSKVNEVDTQSWDESFAENLPTNLLKATAVTLAGAATGGIGGVVLAGIFAADGAVKYANGTVVNCGSCGREFKI